MTWEPAEPADAWERRRLADRGLEALDRFRAAVETRAVASEAADALIAATGGVPPDVGGAVPDADDVREKRLELAGLLLERIDDLRPVFEAERAGLSYGERFDVPREKLPPDFADSYTPRPVLDRMVREAEWIAGLVGA